MNGYIHGHVFLRGGRDHIIRDHIRVLVLTVLNVTPLHVDLIDILDLIDTGQPGRGGRGGRGGEGGEEGREEGHGLVITHTHTHTRVAPPIQHARFVHPVVISVIGHRSLHPRRRTFSRRHHITTISPPHHQHIITRLPLLPLPRTSIGLNI